MNRIVTYNYFSWTLSCECSSDSSSTYDLEEDGKLLYEDITCALCSNEEELREELKHLLPFQINYDDTTWF